MKKFKWNVYRQISQRSDEPPLYYIRDIPKQINSEYFQTFSLEVGIIDEKARPTVWWSAPDGRVPPRGGAAPSGAPALDSSSGNHILPCRHDICASSLLYVLL